jgi:two-component system chemotaxis sensor kinase CheA
MRESADPADADHVPRIAMLLEDFYARHSLFARIVSRLSEAMGGEATNSADPHPFVERISALARRIAADYGKQVEISCQLEPLATLPREVAEELQSAAIPLVHNALMHGIESPDERDRLGKPCAGALRLACEASGTFTVRDDGRGIVPHRLRKHLVKRGRLRAEEAAALDDDEIARLVFQPDVSTADVADRDAKHGIGMDAVLEKVRKINGHLLVKSQPDIFTEFVIQFSVAR